MENGLTLGNGDFGAAVFGTLAQATMPILQANVTDSGAYGLAAVPVEPFFKHPDYRSLKLSPSGRYLVDTYSQPDVEPAADEKRKPEESKQPFDFEQAIQLDRNLAEALRDIAESLNGTLEFNKVLDRILENIGRVVPSTTAVIMLMENGIARSIRHRGYSSYQLTEWVETLRINCMEFHIHINSSM